MGYMKPAADFRPRPLPPLNILPQLSTHSASRYSSRPPAMSRSNTLTTRLRPGDTPYPRPKPCEPFTPIGEGKKPDPLEKGMWE